MSLIYTGIKKLIIEKKIEKILYIKVLNNSLVINLVSILLQIIISFILNNILDF